MVAIMVMNDPLPLPWFNINRPSHSEIQLFQNLTIKILGVYGQRSRSYLTFNIQRSRPLPRSNPLVTFEAWNSIDMFAFHFVVIQTLWLRYSKFHVWPWIFKFKIMAKLKSYGHIWGPDFNRYVCFLFLGNQTIFGWDIANSIIQLDN